MGEGRKDGQQQGLLSARSIGQIEQSGGYRGKQIEFTYLLQRDQCFAVIDFRTNRDDDDLLFQLAIVDSL